MNLPINTEKVRFLVSRPPMPVMDWSTGQLALNPEGLGYFKVELVAMTEGSGAEVIKVKVAGEPRGLSQHLAVKVTGLQAHAWMNKERASSGITYLAVRIEPVSTSVGG